MYVYILIYVFKYTCILALPSVGTVFSTPVVPAAPVSAVLFKNTDQFATNNALPVLVSSVLSISYGDNASPVSDIAPLEFSLVVGILETGSIPSCSYFDLADSYTWISDGCTTVSHNLTSNVVQCRCTHTVGLLK